MSLKTEKFNLRKTSVVGDVSVPQNYDNNRDFITIDMGELTRKDECVVLFEYESDKLKITDMATDCGCTSASDYYKLEDGKYQIKLKYNTKRIGNQDKGSFQKPIKVRLQDGESINFKLKIKEKV